MTEDLHKRKRVPHVPIVDLSMACVVENQKRVLMSTIGEFHNCVIQPLIWAPNI